MLNQNHRRIQGGLGSQAPKARLEKNLNHTNA